MRIHKSAPASDATNFRILILRGCEDAGGYVAFKDKYANKFGQMEQREAEDRRRLMFTNSYGKPCPHCVIADDHRFASVLDVMKNRLREQRVRSHFIAKADNYLLVTPRGFSSDPAFATSEQDH